MNQDETLTRQQRREKRQRKKWEHMAKHGKNLAKVYKNAVLKRQKQGPTKP